MSIRKWFFLMKASLNGSQVDENSPICRILVGKGKMSFFYPPSDLCYPIMCIWYPIIFLPCLQVYHLRPIVVKITSPSIQFSPLSEVCISPSVQCQRRGFGTFIKSPSFQICYIGAFIFLVCPKVCFHFSNVSKLPR